MSHLTSFGKHKTPHSMPSMLDSRDTIASRLQCSLGPAGGSEVTTPKSYYHMMNAFILLGTKDNGVTKGKATLGGESFREQKAETLFWGKQDSSGWTKIPEGCSTEGRPWFPVIVRGLASSESSGQLFKVPARELYAISKICQWRENYRHLLNNKHLFRIVLESGKSEIWLSADSVLVCGHLSLLAVC